MQIEAFRAYMNSQNLAAKTKYMREKALVRIERFEGINLDELFEEDALEGLMEKFRYSRSDERSGRSNPTQMNVTSGREFAQLAWYRVHLGAYRDFRQDGGDYELLETDDDASVDTADGQVFGLERDMQSALRQSLEQLEDGLKAIDDGREVSVEAGRIDILAEDASGRLVVIELKAGTSRPDVIAQTLSYMACVKSEHDRDVRGIIVAADHHSRVKLAAQAIPNVTLKTYRYSFQFS